MVVALLSAVVVVTVCWLARPWASQSIALEAIPVRVKEVSPRCP